MKESHYYGDSRAKNWEISKQMLRKNTIAKKHSSSLSERLRARIMRRRRLIRSTIYKKTQEELKVA